MHDQEDVTEITFINPKPTRPPSLWLNMITLILLFVLVVGARYLSNRWLTKTPPAENMEKQIVLEDLENEKPIADSTTMAMPAEATVPTPAPEPAAAPVVTTKAAPAPEATSAPGTTPAVEPAKPVEKKEAPAKKHKKVAKKKAATKKPVAKKTPAPESDPYTNGGPLDLDRRENQGKQTSQTTKASASPVATPQMNERDQLIPFESN